MAKCAACLVFLCVVLDVASASLDEDWKAYKERFSKHYGPEEDIIRKEAFAVTNHLVKQHQKLSSTWKLAHNRLSDMGKQRRNAAFSRSVDARHRVDSGSNITSAFFGFTNGRPEIPDHLDYRQDPCMGPIRDHNPDQCKSDWAFAATHAIEFKKCKQSGYQIKLSEQQLIDCDPNSRGCLGGNAVYAWAYLMNCGGSVRETDYPYGHGNAYVCGFHGQGVSARVLGFAYAGRGYSNAVEKSLLRYGPLATEMEAPLSFYYYSGGLYDDAYCGTGDALVAVVIVGYGTHAGVPYWIVRGSFGEWWGEDGYMYVRRGVNLCNIEYLAAYVMVA